MKLQEHRFGDLYRQGFRLEVMQVSTGTWVRVATFKVESSDNRHAARQAFGYYEELKALIESDQPIPPLGLCKGIVLWADPLVACHLEQGLDAATPSLVEAFDAMSDAVEHVAGIAGAQTSPGVQVLRAARKLLGRPSSRKMLTVSSEPPKESKRARKRRTGKK